MYRKSLENFYENLGFEPILLFKSLIKKMTLKIFVHLGFEHLVLTQIKNMKKYIFKFIEN